MTTILVVEDEPSLRELMSTLIKEMNYTVLQAENGLKALEVMQKVEPDVVISDVMMPVMDGYILLNEIKLRPEWSNIKVVLISAAPINRTQQPTADEYISKPYDLDGIEVLIQRLTKS